jgi:hypothetical protein
MKNLTADINLDDEVKHLAEYIRQKWTPVADLEALFTEVRAAAEYAARTWFDSHPLWLATNELADKRTALLAAKYGPTVYPDLYDALVTLLQHIRNDAREVSDVARSLDGQRWNFEARVKKLSINLEVRYPDLTNARPLGWAELEPRWKDYAGQDEYDPEPDQDLFQGVRVQGSRSDYFPGRVAVPYVMHDEKNRNCKASAALVGAVFAHFLGITEFLNTHRLAQDVVVALPQLHAPDMLYERIVTTGNPVLKVMVQSAPAAHSQAEFEEHVRQMAEFDALSESDKAARKAEGSAAILKMLDGLKNSDPEADRKYAAEKERKRVLLQAAFEI